MPQGKLKVKAKVPKSVEAKRKAKKGPAISKRGRKNVSQAHKKLCAVYGDEALKERQCQNGFAKFRSGYFSLRDQKRSGRPVEVDDAVIKAIIDSDRHSTTREIVEKLHVSHTCIQNHLKELRYVQKIDTWVPYELKETHLTQRINSWDLLKKRAPAAAKKAKKVEAQKLKKIITKSVNAAAEEEIRALAMDGKKSLLSKKGSNATKAPPKAKKGKKK